MDQFLYSWIAVILAIGIPTVALGQSEEPFHHLTLGGGAGFTTSTGNLASTADRGGNVHLNGGYFFNRNFGITGSFIFSELGITRATLNGFNEPDGRAKVYGVTADPTLRLPLRRGISVYALAGAGYVRRTVELTMPIANGTYTYKGRVVTKTSNMVMERSIGSSGGFDVGGGLNLPSPWTNVKTFLEVRYYKGFTSNINTTVVPITFGFRW